MGFLTLQKVTSFLVRLVQFRDSKKDEKEGTFYAVTMPRLLRTVYSRYSCLLAMSGIKIKYLLLDFEHVDSAWFVKNMRINELTMKVMLVFCNVFMASLVMHWQKTGNGFPLVLAS